MRANHSIKMKSANVTSVTPGEVLKQRGIRRAADAERRKDPGWPGRALEAIERVATHNEYLDADLVRDHGIDEPHHPNAWGSVWQEAIRREWIEESHDQPRRKSSRPEAHAAKMTRYRSLIYY